jgi:hypothetical protein
MDQLESKERPVQPSAAASGWSVLPHNLKPLTVDRSCALTLMKNKPRRLKLWCVFFSLRCALAVM